MRSRIVGMREAGMAFQDIARNLAVSLPTVRLWCRRWEESGNLNDLPRSGAPRKTTPEDDGAIVEEAVNNPHINAVAIKAQLHLDVSDETIRKRLHENGIHHRIPAVKGVLGDIHKRNRLDFARRYVDEGMDCCSRVILVTRRHSPLTPMAACIVGGATTNDTIPRTSLKKPGVGI